MFFMLDHLVINGKTIMSNTTNYLYNIPPWIIVHVIPTNLIILLSVSTENDKVWYYFSRYDDHVIINYHIYKVPSNNQGVKAGFEKSDHLFSLRYVLFKHKNGALVNIYIIRIILCYNWCSQNIL